MAEKKRYLVGYRHAAILPKATETAISEYVSKRDEVQKLRALSSGQQVLRMTEEEADQLARQDPLLIIEEDKKLEMFLPMPGLGPLVPLAMDQVVRIKTVDELTNLAVGDVTLYCAGEEMAYKGITDGNGIAEIRMAEQEVRRIIASPRNGYWSKVVNEISPDEEGMINLRLKQLPDPAGYSWGHLSLRIDKIATKFTGRGIKIGVIDSGIAEHEDLRTGGGYNTLDGQAVERWNIDEKGHGTHCAGTIAALGNRAGITGVAPDAEIYSLKVFPGGRFSDLIEAINWCVENYMDVISMSLGSSSPSAQIEMALAEAVDRGITCIAAAGNDGGAVAYPAKYDTVIAVAALGRADAFPEDSAHSLHMTNQLSRDGNYFFATFSNYGPEISLCAPGIGIISTVPTGYAAWDGTSMAAPFIAGLAGLILEAYPEIRTGDRQQPELVRSILESASIDLGLPPEMQGAGLPNAALALRAALIRRLSEEKVLAAYRRELDKMLERARSYGKFLEQAIEEVRRIGREEENEEGAKEPLKTKGSTQKEQETKTRKRK